MNILHAGSSPWEWIVAEPTKLTEGNDKSVWIDNSMFSLEERYNRTVTEKQLLGKCVDVCREKKVNDLNIE